MIGDHPNDISSGKTVGKNLGIEVVGVKVQEESKVEEIVSIVKEMGRVLKLKKSVEVSCHSKTL